MTMELAVLSNGENATLQFVRDAGGLDKAADLMGVPRAAFRAEVRALQRKLQRLEQEWAADPDYQAGEQAVIEEEAARREAGLEPTDPPDDVSAVCVIGSFSNRGGVPTFEDDMQAIFAELRAKRGAPEVA